VRPQQSDGRSVRANRVRRREWQVVAATRPMSDAPDPGELKDVASEYQRPLNQRTPHSYPAETRRPLAGLKLRSKPKLRRVWVLILRVTSKHVRLQLDHVAKMIACHYAILVREPLL
jgi:hypothetical protein